MARKRFKLLACRVLHREISLLSAKSDNYIDVTYLQQGLHRAPEVLRKVLQDEINRIEDGTDIYSGFSYNVHGGKSRENMEYDAILLGYGLCSNAVCGITSNNYKIIIPRAHDCITLFLGSKERYRNYFDSHSGGIFWYTPGWIDCCQMPGEETNEIKRKRYMEQYDDEELVEEVLEQENAWMKSYKMFTYVDWDELHMPNHIAYTEKCANYFNVGFELLKGDMGLMQKFLEGDWNDEDFIVLKPGQAVSPSYDESILTV